MNDGSVKGVRYFDAYKNKGIFVQRDKLVPALHAGKEDTSVAKK